MKVRLRWALFGISTLFGSVVFAQGTFAGQHFDLAVTYTDGRIAALSISASSIQAAIAYEQKQPFVKNAEVNQRYHASVIPNDPNFSDQAALTKIAAPQAWDTRTDASNVLVAVLDSGVDDTNPDLVQNIWTNPGEIAGNGKDDDGNGYVDDVHGWNYIENSNDPRPQLTPGASVAGINHGTAIAGIIGAEGNNGIAGSGVAWHVKLLPVRVLDSTGSGTTVTVAQGIQYAVAMGARVINLSFVGEGTSAVLQDAINAAYAKGVLVVAAAGNTNTDLTAAPEYPVCYAHVLGVASVSADDTKASYSNYGSCIDISAPGDGVFSTGYYDPAHGYPNIASGGWYGTSVASPFVAGAAALALAQEPALTPDSLTTLLQKTSAPIAALNSAYPGGLGSGRLNLAGLFGAVSSVLIRSQDILAIPLAGDSPRVRDYSAQKKLQFQFWSGEAKNNTGSVIAAGKVMGDGASNIITASLAGSEPRVRVFDRNGKQVATFLAFAKTYHGGVSLAVGDVTGDGVDDIIVGTQTGTGQVRIFSGTGKLLNQFFALASNYRGGVRLATADANNDGRSDIIVASATGQARVAMYQFSGKFIRSFLAFPTTYHSGVNVTAGDVNGDGVPEVVVGELQGTTRVRTLSLTGKLLYQFTAYPQAKQGGVNVAVGDVNADGVADILTGTGPGISPEVRTWKNLGQTRLSVFLAFSATSRSGISVAGIPAR